MNSRPIRQQGEKSARGLEIHQRPPIISASLLLYDWLPDKMGHQHSRENIAGQGAIQLKFVHRAAAAAYMDCCMNEPNARQGFGPNGRLPNNGSSSDVNQPAKGDSTNQTPEVSSNPAQSGTRGRGRPENALVGQRDERIRTLKRQNRKVPLKQFVPIVQRDEKIRELCQRSDGKVKATPCVVKNALYRYERRRL